MSRALNEARAELQLTKRHIGEATAALAELHRHQGELYRDLAKLRLDMLADEEIVTDLEASDRRAKELLRQRDADLAALQSQIEARLAARSARDTERSEIATRVDELHDQIDALEARTQDRLKDDAAYQAQLIDAREAEAVAARAERKAQQAAEDRIEKGRQYEADPLFMYLWSRGYGTSRYQASHLIQFFDRWVARHCDYASARPNYAMLLEIPARLGEHVERLRASADAKAAQLEQIERDALVAEGVTPLTGALDQAVSEMEQLDNQISDAEEAHAQLLAKHSRLVGGEDETYRKAIDVLVAASQRDKLRALYRGARATPMPEDDAIIEGLEEIESRSGDLEEEIAQDEALLRSQEKRVGDLEDVLQDFRRQGFDRRHSRFADPEMIGMLLNEFLRGVVSRDRLWDDLRRQQRFERRQADRTFGSGSLRRRSSGGVFGGGFRTGGRMGGGGFRTGGSF